MIIFFWSSHQFHFKSQLTKWFPPSYLDHPLLNSKELFTFIVLLMLHAWIFQRSCSKLNPLIPKTYPSVCFNFQLVSASCITYQSIFILRLQIRFALPLYLWTFPAEFKPHFPSSRTNWPFCLINDKCHWLSTFGGWEFSRSSLRFLYLSLENKYQTILISLPFYGDEYESFFLLLE